MQVDWPGPRRRLRPASYVSVPERETSRRAGRLMIAGIMPILHSPSDHAGNSGRRGAFVPGAPLHLHHGMTGDAFVMQTMIGTSAEIASRIASAANGGGT